MECQFRRYDWWFYKMMCIIFMADNIGTRTYLQFMPKYLIGLKRVGSFHSFIMKRLPSSTIIWSKSNFGMVNAFFSSLYSFYVLFCLFFSVRTNGKKWNGSQLFFSELFNRNSKKKRSEMKIRRVPIENSLHKNVKLCNKFAEMVCLPMCVWIPWNEHVPINDFYRCRHSIQSHFFIIFICLFFLTLSQWSLIIFFLSHRAQFHSW